MDNLKRQTETEVSKNSSTVAAVETQLGDKELQEREQMYKEQRAKNRQAFTKRLWLTLNMIFTVIYLIWRIFYTLPLEYGIVSIIAGLALIIVEVLGFGEALVHFFNMNKIENYALPDVPLNRFPDVDIFIATYTETPDLLYKTVNGCLHIDYPDKSKVHVYLCDDGSRPEVQKLAAEKGIGYITREKHEGAKAGNLNNAISITASPLLVTLDADMIPQSDFLMKTVPYFVDAEIKNEGKEEKDKVKMGFVQSPQSFYNPDLFQFNLFSEGRIPNEQDYFYKDIQVARNKSNSVIYGGSNTLISRAALADVGGFYTGSITEDFATGILIQKKKYKCIAINEVIASGLSANDLDSLIQQRIRWARGCINSGRKLHILLSKDLTFSQKINYWASIVYWYAPIKRFIYIMSPIIFAVFGYMVIKCTIWEVLIFWLPMYISSNISLKLFSQNIRTTKWTNIYETIMFPFMIVPILLESLGISLKKFRVTNKESAVAKNREFIVHLIPFAIFIILSIIGIINMARIILTSGVMSPVVVLFWLSINMFNLVMAAFFITGRRIFRASERVMASAPCELDLPTGTIQCTTKDFSETGLSIMLKHPVDIDENEAIPLRLETDKYKCELKVKVVHVDRVGGAWKYAFNVEDYGDTFDDYLQIIYDRVPTLPLNLSKQLSSFDDLRINVSRRTQKTVFQNRRYARIEIDQEVVLKDGTKVKLDNFNYKYILLDGENIPEYVTLELKNGLEVDAKFERVVYNGMKLYAVTNYDEIHDSEYKSELLQAWVLEKLAVPEPEQEKAFA